jgi:hypothetical protein
LSSSRSTRFDVYGRIEDRALAKYALEAGLRIFNEVPRAEIPSLLSSYSVLMYHPNIIDAFCIKVVEAELAGMSLEVDRERIGRFSFDVDSVSLSRYMEHLACLRIAKIIDAFLA